MAASIAVCQNKNVVCGYSDAAELAVYEKQESGGWLPVRTVPLPPSGGSMNEVRDSVRDVVGQLGECSILAGQDIGGLPYGIFDRMGFHIFFIQSVADETFEAILTDITDGEAKAELKRQMLANVGPVETAEPGIYFLDLAALQESCPDISSKRALRSFLADTPFLALHLQCEHLPPWLEQEPGLDIRYTSDLQGAKRYMITKKGLSQL